MFILQRHRRFIFISDLCWLREILWLGSDSQTTYYIATCNGLFHRSIDDIAILFCFFLKCPNLNSLTWAQYHTTSHSNDINISDTTRCHHRDPDNIPSDLRFLWSFSFPICFVGSSENEDRADNMWILYTQLLSKPDAIHIIKRAKESAYIDRLRSNNQHCLQSVCITISLRVFFR